MKTNLPPVRLSLTPGFFDLLMAALESNAENVEIEEVKERAKDLMEKRMRYTKIYTDENGPYASIRMYESEAAETIFQLLIAVIGSVDITKEYSKELMERGLG